MCRFYNFKAKLACLDALRAKFCSESSDHNKAMLDSGTMILLISALASGICILCLYSVYANVIRHETTLHNLRNRVEELSNQQALHLAEITGELTPEMKQSDVEIIHDPDLKIAETDPENLSESQASDPTSSSTKAA